MKKEKVACRTICHPSTAGCRFYMISGTTSQSLQFSMKHKGTIKLKITQTLYQYNRFFVQ